MGIMLYKVVISKEIQRFNSIASICSRLSSEELYRTFVKKNNHLDLNNISVMLSDALPFIGEKYFIPKPAAIIDGLTTLDITNQKALRTIDYIEISEIKNYFSGTYDYLAATKNKFGSFKKTSEGTMFKFVSNAGLYVIIDCDNAYVLKLFVSFLRKYILELFDINIDISEQVVKDAVLENRFKKISKYKIALSSLYTGVTENTLFAVCNNASYIVVEKQLTGDESKLCYLKSGAVISQEGLKTYNSSHQPGCIAIGC